jgi:glucosyl-dolichyl phosphate glucuronosyltransferase
MSYHDATNQSWEFLVTGAAWSPTPAVLPTAPGGRDLAVTVVICAYTMKRWEQTRLAIASVQRQDPGPAQLLMVVDHNADLAERARHELTGVTVVESEGVRGLSGARNTGLLAATEPITVFLDDDAEARPHWLAPLVEPYDNPLVIATGGGVIPRWPTGRPQWLPPEFDWVVGCSYAGLPQSTGPLRNPIGANMSLRTELALTAGGFDGSIGRVGTKPRGCEETELAIRLASATPGAHAVYVPAAAVDHYVGAERTTAGYFLRRCWHEGQSKASVVRMVGASSGLERERRQAAVVIPVAAMRNLRDLLRGDLGAGRRMIALAAGLAAAACGYMAGTVTRWAARGS